MSPIDLSGQTRDAKRHWNTYLFWARVLLDPATPRRKFLVIGRASERLPRSRSAHLQSVIFVAFALEYRLKRVYEELGLSYRQKDTLGPLLQNFKRRVESAQRLDGSGQIRLPEEWTSIEPRLRNLIELRNAVAHPDYQRLDRIWPKAPGQSRATARKCFNALVDMIRVTNAAIGYDSTTRSEARRYFSRLKIV
jgi:hypothetical protein